ncbi:hypothetical protein Lal_00027921 [Lupinus albus]|nr:hypothetical protein Lal_00027921 [Lupinus albus]
MLKHEAKVIPIQKNEEHEDQAKLQQQQRQIDEEHHMNISQKDVTTLRSSYKAYTSEKKKELSANKQTALSDILSNTVYNSQSISCSRNSKSSQPLDFSVKSQVSQARRNSRSEAKSVRHAGILGQKPSQLGTPIFSVISNHKAKARRSSQRGGKSK